jgi:hypothetical protein
MQVKAVLDRSQQYDGGKNNFPSPDSPMHRLSSVRYTTSSGPNRSGWRVLGRILLSHDSSDPMMEAQGEARLKKNES